MNIVFYDPARWDYDGETPRDIGLGGSQSACCYLAEELAAPRRNHRVTIVNGVSQRRIRRGVMYMEADSPATDELLKACDVLVVLNSAYGKPLRGVGYKGCLVLWTQHDADQPAVRNLAHLEERAAWDGIITVSRYQQERYKKLFNIDTVVIGNAAGPCFHAEPLRDPWYVSGESPVLAYTSTPFRGLNRLLDAFPAIREAVPGLRLKIFSSMQVYRQEEGQWQALYERARPMPGVEYIGSVGQRRLAAELAGCAILAYPSTFPETYCIAAAEAVTVGCIPVVPPLGALGETLGPAGIYVTTDDYARAVKNVLKWHTERPEVTARVRGQSIDRFRTECTWARRAAEWEAVLTTMVAL